jgi:hypothetical protein
MTEFEMKLFKDLQNGKTMDEITAEFAKHLSAAEAEHKAIEEKKAAAAKAEEEAKARAELEKAGTAIAELANRMLNGELTAEDVEWVITSYLEQDDSNLDHMITSAIEKVFGNLFTKVKPVVHKCDCQSDDDVIRSFVERIL